MNLARQQKGMTGIGWLLIIALIVFVMLIVVKLLPAYVDHFNVSSVLSSLEKEPDIDSMSAGEITQTIMKRLDINMVKDVQPDDIYVSQEGTTRVIEIDYRVQRKLFANIDILISFNNRIEVPAR